MHFRPFFFPHERHVKKWFCVFGLVFFRPRTTCTLTTLTTKAVPDGKEFRNTLKKKLRGDN